MAHIAPAVTSLLHVSTNTSIVVLHIIVMGHPFLLIVLTTPGNNYATKKAITAPFSESRTFAADGKILTMRE